MAWCSDAAAGLNYRKSGIVEPLKLRSLPPVVEVSRPPLGLISISSVNDGWPGRRLWIASQIEEVDRASFQSRRAGAMSASTSAALGTRMRGSSGASTSL